MAGQKLPSAIAARTNTPHALRTAVVKSFNATGLVITVAGGDIPAALVGSSSGVFAGATVSVIVQEDTWLVLGPSNGAGNGRTNSLILAAQQQQSNGNYVTGLGTGSEVSANRQLSAIMPLNHLCEIRFLANVTISVANGSAGYRIRENSVGGTQVGSGHSFGPTSGFTYEAIIVCHIIGDGLSHTYLLTVQNFTGGTLTLGSSSSSRMANTIIDLGDASGVNVT